jgi:PTH1 family peptidyl-tRNA hydrolase
MKILVGLGNPGREHLLNRHNLGFLVLDAWAARSGEAIKKKEFRSEVLKTKMGGADVLLMKPLTYMNHSGEALQEAMSFHKVPIEDVIVVHDELDIPPQSFRLKRGGGHGGHNGLRSILPLGDAFFRVRMGIGRPPHPGMEVADFVLGNLLSEDLAFWQKEMERVHEAIELAVQGKAELAMNQFNRKG